MTADLFWFPFYAAEWLGSSACSSMLPEQEGAFIRLLAIAWGNGSREPSLPTDVESLARMSRLGQRWKRLGGLILSQFEERNGRYFNAKLSTVWGEQQDAYRKRSKAGRKGGEAKAANKQRASDASGNATAGLKQSELEPSVEQSFTSSVLPEVALDSALAPSEAQRSSGAEGIPGDEPPTEPGESGRAVLERQYFERLTTRFDAWCAKNAEKATELERIMRVDFDIPENGGMLESQRLVLRDAMLEAVRERQGWPTSEEFIASLSDGPKEEAATKGDTGDSTRALLTRRWQSAADSIRERLERMVAASEQGVPIEEEIDRRFGAIAVRAYRRVGGRERFVSTYHRPRLQRELREEFAEVFADEVKATATSDVSP